MSKIDALRTHIGSILPKMPGIKKAAKIKRVKALSTVTKVRSGATTFTTPTIGSGY